MAAIFLPFLPLYKWLTLTEVKKSFWIGSAPPKSRFVTCNEAGLKNGYSAQTGHFSLIFWYEIIWSRMCFSWWKEQYKDGLASTKFQRFKNELWQEWKATLYFWDWFSSPKLRSNLMQLIVQSILLQFKGMHLNLIGEIINAAFSI